MVSFLVDSSARKHLAFLALTPPEFFTFPGGGVQTPPEFFTFPGGGSWGVLRANQGSTTVSWRDTGCTVWSHPAALSAVVKSAIHPLDPNKEQGFTVLGEIQEAIFEEKIFRIFFTQKKVFFLASQYKTGLYLDLLLENRI